MDKEQEHKEYDECKEYSSMVAFKNLFKMSESTVYQEQIKRLLDKNIPIKAIQYIISTVNKCEQKMIEFGI